MFHTSRKDDRARPLTAFAIVLLLALAPIVGVAVLGIPAALHPPRLLAAALDGGAR